VLLSFVLSWASTYFRNPLLLAHYLTCKALEKNIIGYLEGTLYPWTSLVEKKRDLLLLLKSEWEIPHKKVTCLCITHKMAFCGFYVMSCHKNACMCITLMLCHDIMHESFYNMSWHPCNTPLPFQKVFTNLQHLELVIRTLQLDPLPFQILLQPKKVIYKWSVVLTRFPQNISNLLMYRNGWFIFSNPFTFVTILCLIFVTFSLKKIT
jgi:hypothetical protein